MAQPAIGAPYRDCSWNVSHKNAPGAISAMALIVRPVKPSVALLVEDEPPDPDDLLIDSFAIFYLLLGGSLVMVYLLILNYPCRLRPASLPERLLTAYRFFSRSFRQPPRH